MERTLFFGTYDEHTHPRVRALREGLRAHGHTVEACNRPLGVSTADRVLATRRPWRAPLIALRVLRAWVGLWRGAAAHDPDVVLVGYLGHFDIHLARRRFPRATLVLDHMVSLGDTARDRGLAGGSPVARFLDTIDRAALRCADIVLVDTEEQAEALPAAARAVVVVPVAAPEPWRRTSPADDPVPSESMLVVFFGLYTPLQGAPTIGEALALLSDCESIAVSMIGTGQDLAVTRSLAESNRRVTWIDWVEASDLPAIVASHHVCLGIFGAGPKAQRVVPNKVLQGATAGCAIVTSDTRPQRRALGDAGCFVAPDDAQALAGALRRLAADRSALAELRSSTRDLAIRELTPEAAIAPLIAHLRGQH